jgi:hypothetical protein
MIEICTQSDTSPCEIVTEDGMPALLAHYCRRLYLVRYQVLTETSINVTVF